MYYFITAVYSSIRNILFKTGTEILEAGPWSKNTRSKFLPCVVRTFLQEKIVTGSNTNELETTSSSTKSIVGSAKIRISIQRVRRIQNIKRKIAIIGWELKMIQ